MKLDRIPKKWFSTIKADIYQASSKKELLIKIVEIKEAIGADYYFCGTFYKHFNRSKDVVYIASDTPDSWQEEYKNEDYIHTDPLIIAARKTNHSFVWEDLTSGLAGDNKIREKAKQYQLNYGITFPVHCCNGAFGFLFLIYKDKPPKMMSRFEHIIPYMQIISIQLVEVLRKLIQNEIHHTELSHPNSLLLTKRQRQCLLWAAEGKTTEEISIILSLSNSTVIHHLELAREKLNSDNRIQCIAKALDQNLIALEHKKRPSISYLRK